MSPAKGRSFSSPSKGRVGDSLPGSPWRSNLGRATRQQDAWSRPFSTSVCYALFFAETKTLPISFSLLSCLYLRLSRNMITLEMFAFTQPVMFDTRSHWCYLPLVIAGESNIFGASQSLSGGLASFRGTGRLPSAPPRLPSGDRLKWIIVSSKGLF